MPLRLAQERTFATVCWPLPAIAGHPMLRPLPNEDDLARLGYVRSLLPSSSSNFERISKYVFLQCSKYLRSSCAC